MPDSSIDKIKSRSRHALNLCAAALLVCLPTLPALADEGDLYMPDADQRQKILGGEIVSVPVATSDKGGTVWGAVYIEAPAEDIFNAIVYCNGETSAHKTMRKCTIVEQSDTHEIVEHNIKYHWYVPKQTYLFRADHTGFEQIRFRVLEGDLKKLDGGWDLFPVEGKTGYLVRYYATIQPKIPTPRWLIRKSLKKEIPEMLNIMREISENPERLAKLDAIEAERLKKIAENAKKEEARKIRQQRKMGRG